MLVKGLKNSQHFQLNTHSMRQRRVDNYEKCIHIVISTKEEIASDTTEILSFFPILIIFFIITYLLIFYYLWL